jgi:hypothetical protein
MITRIIKIVFPILVISLMLAACGKSISAGPSNPTQPSTVKSDSGEGGVEAALITYSDAAQGFAIGHPGSWTKDPSMTTGVKYIGGDDWMSLEFITPSAGTDAMKYAQDDVASVTAAFPGFKQLGEIKPSTEVKDAIILGFTADGKSSVTGKSFTSHGERYYISMADGRIAILTVVGPDNHYDREGIRDIAMTFKVSK